MGRGRAGRRITACWLLLGMVATARAATYYVGPAATGDESGSDRTNLMAIAAAIADANRAADTFLLQPGDYGARTFSCYGNADANCLFQADAGTCTARAADWYETDIAARTDVQAPIFGTIVIASRAAGQYLELDGLVIVDGKLDLRAANLKHVKIQNLDCFGVVPADPNFHLSSQRTDNGCDLYNTGTTDRFNVCLDSCYFEGYRMGFNLNGDFGDDIVLRLCHVVDFASSGCQVISTNTIADRNPIALDRLHLHEQHAQADSAKGTSTVEAAGADPTRYFTYVADPSVESSANWVGVTHAGSTSYRPARIAVATRSVYCIVALPFSVSPGDAVAFLNGDHGGGITIRSHAITIRGCRVHDCGSSSMINNYVTGVQDLTFENNLFYAPLVDSATVNFGNAPHGSNFRFVHNTVFGRGRPANYSGNGAWRYGYCCWTSYVGGATNIVFANNVFGGLAQAWGTTSNNIVYYDYSGCFDAARGDYEYHDTSVTPGTEATPFETGQGFYVGGVGFDAMLAGTSTSLSINANAMFNLMAGSMAIDFGDPAYGTATDFEGTARDATPDAGHFEYTTPAAPAAVTGLSPADSATGVSITPTITWDESARALSYDVYFGSGSPPASIGNQAGRTYQPGTLDYATTYYVRIDAVNGAGTTAGTEISWTTRAAPAYPAKVILIVEDL